MILRTYPYNPNPQGKKVGDCVVRAITKATHKTWVQTFAAICVQGLMMGDMPSSNAVWGSYLYDQGFDRYIIPDTCPDCYTVRDFCQDHPYGEYVLATGSHVVAVQDGNYYDTWDSGDESPLFYWQKGESHG